MADKNNEQDNKYIYPIEELDRIIEKMNQGITPMMDDQMEIEVKMRFRELQNEIFEDDDVDDELTARHKEMMQRHIEEKKRQATKRDVVIITLTDEQKAVLRDEMETSIVRPNPDSSYNMSDSAVCTSQEQKVIMEKLGRLRNIYYNQQDYVAAINIIKEAIQFSLENDYPWLTKEQAYSLFNQGKIRFNFCNIPKLMIDYRTQITDTEILKGIVEGRVTLRDKNDDDKELKRLKKKEPYEPITVNYTIVGQEEYQEMVAMHKKGYDTPMSHVIKAKSTAYNRYSVPSLFNTNNNQNQNEEPMVFDWEQPGAGERFYNRKIGKRYGLSELISDINTVNNGELSTEFSSNTSQFLYSMNHTTENNGWVNYQSAEQTGYISSSLQMNENAAKIERSIIAAIRANNPTK